MSGSISWSGSTQSFSFRVSQPNGSYHSGSIREVLPATSSPYGVPSGHSTCGLYSRLMERIESSTAEQEELPSTAIAEEIVKEVFTRATRRKPKRKLKPPVMKSGWMDWEKIFPNFNIDDKTFKNLVFNENLIVSTFENDPVCPTPVGALSLDIQPARGGPLNLNKKDKSDFLCSKFLVHLSSQLDFMGHNGGSRITAWVDRALQTLEEKRTEYLKLEDGVDQQTLYVSSQEKFYYLRHDKKREIFHSARKAKNLICEGANFILMRYLATSHYIGTFEVSTVYIDGSLCRNIYDCKGPSSGIVNNTKMDVCKIYRTIIEECGIEHKSITLMTLKGQIIKQEWRFSNYLLQINPLSQVTGKPGAHRIPFENQAYTDDLQLLSLYLDRKSYSKKLIKNYMEDNPEIKNLLSDYLQTILQLKPEDVYSFTAKYFLTLTPSLLPKTEYFEGPFTVDESKEYDYDFWKYI